MSFFDNSVTCTVFTDMIWKCFHPHSIQNALSEDENSVLLKCCVVYFICAVTMEMFQNNISDI